MIESIFEDFIHSRQAKKNVTDNQRFILVSIFEDFIFKPISLTISTCLPSKNSIRNTLILLLWISS